MKIIYVTPRVPFPPTKGDRIRAYHQLRHLSRHHEVHLVSLFDSADDTATDDPCIAGCASTTYVPRGKLGAAVRAAGAFATDTSLTTAILAPPRLARVVGEVCGSDTDVLWISNNALFPPLAGIAARHRIVDLVDVDSEKWRQWAAHHREPRASVYRREARLTRANETTAARTADRCLVISECEAARLTALGASTPPACVLTNGVDLEAFPRTPLAEDPLILFTGALDYAANSDAVSFFAEAVLPIVRRSLPEARFLAAGHKPTAALKAAAQRHQFEVVADVPAIQPYFARARIAVAPMRLGRGLQNKVLEAMASGVPVVATPLALSGLAAWPQPVALRGDTAAELAAGCVELLSDRNRAVTLAQEAHRFVRREHAWDGVFDRIDEILAGLGADHGQTDTPFPTVE